MGLPRLLYKTSSLRWALNGSGDAKALTPVDRQFLFLLRQLGVHHVPSRTSTATSTTVGNSPSLARHQARLYRGGRRPFARLAASRIHPREARCRKAVSA